jgi:hypothetical protein
VKKISEILTVLAAVAVLIACSAPALAAERRPGDATRPGYQQTPGRGERSPHVDAHVDSHVDYRVGGADRDARKEEARPDERERERSRWTPSAERYTRPPSQWRR